MKHHEIDLQNLSIFNFEYILACNPDENKKLFAVFTDGKLHFKVTHKETIFGGSVHLEAAIKLYNEIY